MHTHIYIDTHTNTHTFIHRYTHKHTHHTHAYIDTLYTSSLGSILHSSITRRNPMMFILTATLYINNKRIQKLVLE